jgi:hypothetical protein
MTGQERRGEVATAFYAWGASKCCHGGLNNKPHSKLLFS